MKNSTEKKRAATSSINQSINPRATRKKASSLDHGHASDGLEKSMAKLAVIISPEVERSETALSVMNLEYETINQT